MQSQSQQKKRDIIDFFRPHGQTATVIPKKRPSPSGADDIERITVRKTGPKTPGKKVSFKNVTPKATKTPVFSPKSQNSLPIRSPRPSQTPTPSKSRQTTLVQQIERSPTRDVRPNTSFTFSDVSDRSQRVVENGQLVAVRDSDDETDSIESLDDIFGRKKENTATSNSSPPEDLETERTKVLSLFAGGRSVPIVAKEKIRALNAKERAIKFDLSVVLDDHFNDEEVERNISSMRAGISGMKDTEDDQRLDKRLLASVVQTGEADQDDVERFWHAVERTEALSTEKTFSFFEAGSDTKPNPQRMDVFPKSSIPEQLWRGKNIEAQNRAFLTGYMSELAGSNCLSDDALRWIFNQVVTEPRADLRQTYVQCLQASSETWTRLNISAIDVQSSFRHLGAALDCVRDGSSMEAKHHPVQKQPKQEYQNLVSLLQLFQAVCPDMDFVALSKLSSIILRLALDASVMSDSLVCVAVETLLETLLSLPDVEARSHVHDRLFTDARDHLHDPKLQSQLLGHILPINPLSIALRKTLADTFLLGPQRLDSSTNTSKTTLTDLSNYVSTSPSFSSTRHANSQATDYSALTAMTQILNVAVSSGNPPLPPPSSNSPDGPATISSKPTPEEVQFNAEVDDLADKLHNLFVSIKDTGASHMRRTEAKDALQALYFRLLFSVRTRVRKKKHVFDAGGHLKAGAMGGNHGRWVTGEEFRERERGGEFMKSFLARKQKVGLSRMES